MISACDAPTTLPMKFQSVIFDFDGILVDTEWAIYQAWKRTFEAHGQHLPLDVYTRCIGSDFATWSPKTHLEELTGLAFDWHDLDTRRQHEIEAELMHEGPMHGAVDLLEFLQTAQVPTAVASSSSHRWVDGWLDRLELTKNFHAIVCRGDAPRIKPAPDLFLEAARQLDVTPEHCLVIEDSMNGLKAAKAAGMHAWVIPNRVTECLDFSTADQTFRSLAECISALAPHAPKA
jgi:HAD superfamily hydrolase (TIGR01509 family)